MLAALRLFLCKGALHKFLRKGTSQPWVELHPTPPRKAHDTTDPLFPIFATCMGVSAARGFSVIGVSHSPGVADLLASVPSCSWRSATSQLKGKRCRDVFFFIFF